MGKDTRVASSMIDLRLQLGDTATLEDYLRTSRVLPIGVFYKNSLSQAIKDAIKYMTANKQGSVYIPAQIKGENPIQLVASVNKTGKFQINYITYGYRYPINSESRPLTEDDWQVGDVVYNTDTTINECLGWVCKEAGTPGVWGVVGFIRNWSTELEEVDALPDPGPMQLNRQLVSGGRAYICKCVNGVYNWYWMDYAYGNSSQRPTTDLRVGLPYYNIDTGLPEWYNGVEWVAAAKANHTHPELGGASDTAMYGTATKESGYYVYLPKSKEGFADFSIKGINDGLSDLKLFSRENLFRVEDLKPIEGNSDSSFLVEDEQVKMSTSEGGASIVAEITIPVEPSSKYAYGHKETYSKHRISYEILEAGAPHRGLPAGDNDTHTYTYGQIFDTGVQTREITIRYSFESTAPADSITYLNNIFVAKYPTMSRDTPDLSLLDYVSSTLYKSGDVSDEYNGKQLITRILKSTLLDKYKDPVEYLNSGTYLIDGFVLMQFDQRHGTISDTTYLPESNSEISSIQSQYSGTNVQVESYNTAKLGSDTNILLGISEEGIIVVSMPLWIMSNNNIVSAYDALTNNALMNNEIKFIRKQEVISEFSRLPTPIRVHERGVVFVSSNGTAAEISITYPKNSAATAKSNADVIDLMLHDRVQYGSAPLTWGESGKTWAEAASANKDWRGE